MTPATRLRKAISLIPGSKSPVQFAAVFQLVLPPPPSQQTPVQLTPLAVSRYTLPTIALLTPDGRLRVVKLPLALPPAVITSKLCPTGVKPLMRGLFRVPARFTLPDTARTSY